MYRASVCAALTAVLAGCAGPSSSSVATRSTLEMVSLDEPLRVTEPAPLPPVPLPPPAPAPSVTTPQFPSPGSAVPSMLPPPATPQPGLGPQLSSGKPWPADWSNVWVPLPTWAQVNGLAAPARLTSGADAQFALRSPRGSIRLRTGSQNAYVTGHDCLLGYPPRMVSGVPYVHSLDLEKTLQPLLAGNFQPGLSNRVVVIDAGHGGRDSGTTGRTLAEQEKYYTLDWARRVHRLLTEAGWTVYLTRTNDVDVPLADRVGLAERVNAALFVSLHFNSGTQNSEMSGVETYCLTPAGLPSTLRRGFEDDPRDRFPNNSFDQQNVLLASRLHRSILGATGAPDRGVRRARFMTVLRGQNRPAVLIEGGYLSNPSEARRISTAEYRQSLAQAVAQALTFEEAPGPASTDTGHDSAAIRSGTGSGAASP